MHRSLLAVFAICSLLIISCESNVVYDSYESFPNGWEKDSLATFEVSNIDSTKTYNLFIQVRNNNEYKYSNLFLISEIIFPHGRVVSDTLEYEMAAPSGEWLGTGFGEVKESKLWLKEHVSFVEEGTYRVTLQQAMRRNGEDEGIENLGGITEVGIRIENSSTESAAQ